MTPRRPESQDETPFKTFTIKAADHLLSTVDGRVKSFVGEQQTYADIRNIVRNIQKSGYFDKAAQPPPPPPVVEVPEPIPEPVSEEPTVESEETQSVDATPVEEEIAPAEPDFQLAPAAAAVPAPSFPPQQSALPPQLQQSVPLLTAQQQQPPLLHQPTQQQQLNGPPAQLVQAIPMVQPMVPVVGVPAGINPQQAQSQQLHLAPTTVRAVEQAYFKQHQYITQMRPLAEVINAQNFFFLQESELDQPDVMQPQQQQQGVSGFPPTSAQISPNVQQPNQQQQQHLQQAHLLQQQQHQQQQQHLSGAIRSAPQQQQQQIPPQPFNNQQPFPNVLPGGAPLFPGNLNPGDLPPSHIPGFVNPNAPIPIPLLNQQQQQPQQQQPPLQQHQPAQQLQQQQNHLQQQHQQQQLQQNNAPIPTFQQQQQQQQTGTGFLSGLQAISAGQQSSTSLSSVKLNQASQLPIDVDNRPPEINEWKPEDAIVNPDELSSEWQGQFFQAAPVVEQQPEVSDWNDETTGTSAAAEAVADEGSDWSPNNGQHRFPYRNNNQSGGYNGGRGHNNNRSGGGGGARNSSVTTNTESTNSGTNTTGSNHLNGGYRNRSNYNNNQSNGGGGAGNRSQQQQSQSSSGGGGNGGTSGTSSGTFYRNNESYYQNGNNNNGGGGSGYRGGDKSGSGGGYRDNKADGGGFRGGHNNFRSRDTSGNSAPVRNNNNSGITNRPHNNNNNSRYNSDSVERGSTRTNTTNNGPSPVGGSSGHSSNRGLATATKHSSGVYGGGPRPSGAARQTVNV